MAKEILQMWLRILGNYNLDYPGGLNIVTRVLIGRRQESQGQRRCDDGSRGHRDIPGAMGCRGPLSRSRRRQGHRFSSAPPEGKKFCRHLDFDPPNLISDIRPLKLKDRKCVLF